VVAAHRCTLISASCTTGWFDWIHGELWLCTDGLLRRALGLDATRSHRFGPTVDPANRPTRSFSDEDIDAMVAADPRNRWIAWGSISQATLKLGIIDHSLHLRLADGSREKFLWLKRDRGYDVLEAALGAVLGNRFRAVNKAVG
jgi:hypothetical protein